jgi:hypothetical protein
MLVMTKGAMESVDVSYDKRSNGKCGCYLWRAEQWKVWLLVMPSRVMGNVVLVMASRAMEFVAISYGDQSNGGCGF